jgi:hypothetical protein
MHSAPQKVPCEDSRRQSAQTGLLHLSQLATAGVSPWFSHWEPIGRHLVPSATMGMGSSEGGAWTSSRFADGDDDGASSKIESIFWTTELPPDEASAAAPTNFGTSCPLANAVWHSEEQKVPSFSSTTHMRQTDLSQALHVASAIDSGWLAQLLSMRSPKCCPWFSIYHGIAEVNVRREKTSGGTPGNG